MPIFDAENACGLDLLLVLLLVNILVVLVFKIDLVVRDHLIVGQTHLSIDEKLITMHEQRAKVARAKRLTCSQNFILSRVLKRVS